MAKLGIMLQKAIIYCSSVLWASHVKALSVCSTWDGNVPMRMRTMLLPKAIPVSQTPFMSDFVPLQRTYKGAFGIQRNVKFLRPASSNLSTSRGVPEGIKKKRENFSKGSQL
jgi:hypothetical protein